MSPHGLVLLLAASIGFVGKLVFPARTLLVLLVAAAAFPIGLTLFYGDISLLGFLLISSITCVGAFVGVLGAKLARDVWSSQQS